MSSSPLLLQPAFPLQKLSVDLTALLGMLQSRHQKLQQSLKQGNHSSGSNRLYDLYWQSMRMLGVQYVLGEGRTYTLEIRMAEKTLSPVLCFLSLSCILPYRRPKSEKKNAKGIPSDTQNTVSMKRKKKGFLPETKKRKKLKSKGATPEKEATSGQDAVTEDATPAAAGQHQPPSTGKKKKRKRMRANTPSRVNGTPMAKSPAPNNPTLSPSTPAKTPKLQKKKEELPQVNGATPVSPIEPEGKKHHQKALTAKVIRKTQSALPQKRARLSLVSRSPSLLQSGVKKRRVVRKKVQTP